MILVVGCAGTVTPSCFPKAAVVGAAEREVLAETGHAAATSTASATGICVKELDIPGCGPTWTFPHYCTDFGAGDTGTTVLQRSRRRVFG